MSLIQPTEVLNRTNGWVRGNPSCLSAWARTLVFYPQTRSYTINSPGSQAFGLRWNYTTGFSGSLAFWIQILGLLRLQNHVSHLYSPTYSEYFSMWKMHSFYKVCSSLKMTHRYKKYLTQMLKSKKWCAGKCLTSSSPKNVKGLVWSFCQFPWCYNFHQGCFM